MAAHRECRSSVLLDNVNSVHHILAGGCCAYNATHVFDLVVETEARVCGGCLHHTVHVRGQSKLKAAREREGARGTLKAIDSMNLAAPEVASVSSRLPLPTKTPIDAQCPGVFSLMTRTPFDRVVISELQYSTAVSNHSHDKKIGRGCLLWLHWGGASWHVHSWEWGGERDSSLGWA